MSLTVQIRLGRRLIAGFAAHRRGVCSEGWWHQNCPALQLLPDARTDPGRQLSHPPTNEDMTDDHSSEPTTSSDPKQTPVASGATESNRSAGDLYYGRFNDKPGSDEGTQEGLSPQIDAIIDDLAQLCAQSMTEGEVFDDDSMEGLIDALSTNGWERHSVDLPPLSTVVEIRTREKFLEPAMHRGGALENLTAKIQKAYNERTRFKTAAPRNRKPPADDPSTQPQQVRHNLNGPDSSE